MTGVRSVAAHARGTQPPNRNLRSRGAVCGPRPGAAGGVRRGRWREVLFRTESSANNPAGWGVSLGPRPSGRSGPGVQLRLGSARLPAQTDAASRPALQSHRWDGGQR
jgi:hypothetical protein